MCALLSLEVVFLILIQAMLTRTVVILSIVSLFADIASEMLYPIMPLYLQYIGFSAIGLGFIEGLANATAGLCKGYFGYLSDKTQKRMPFVQAGYALSAISKPLTVLSVAASWIVGVRILDRIGKGIRTAPRDAVLADESKKEHRGRVFGFHRSLDTLGATLGPACALVLIYLYPKQYSLIFILAFIPGVVSILLTLMISDKNHANKIPKNTNNLDNNGNPFRFFGYWKQANEKYKRAIILFTGFALINSADAFLLLRLHDIGFTDQQVIGTYLFYNAVYALCAYPFGSLGDKIGMKPTYIGGMLLFAGIYIAMGFVNSFYVALFLFMLYGIYAAATESIAKAWISQLCQPKETATAIGMYATLISLAALVASIWTGFVWQYMGAMWAFVISGICAAGLAAFGMKKL